MVANVARTLLLLLIHVAPAHSSRGVSQPPSKVVSVDLRSLSPIHALGPLIESGGHAVTFLDQDHIALALSFPSPPPNSQHPSRESFHTLLILVLNAKTGKAESSRSWLDLVGGADQRTNLAHAKSGELLLLLGSRLLRLSSTLETRAERALDPADYWYLMVSSSGDSALLLQTSPSDLDSIQAHWISTQTLADVKRAPGKRVPTVLTDNAIIYSPIPRPPYNEGSLKDKTPLVLDDQGQTTPLCASCPGVALAAFGDGFVVVGHEPFSSYSIVDRKGALIFNANHGGQVDSVIRAATAFSTANRIALLYGHIGDARPGPERTSFSDPPTHIAENTIIVFDADKLAEIVQMPVSDFGEWSGNQMSFITPKLGLSPDGKLLAVLYTSALQVFQLP